MRIAGWRPLFLTVEDKEVQKEYKRRKERVRTNSDPEEDGRCGGRRSGEASGQAKCELFTTGRRACARAIPHNGSTNWPASQPAHDDPTNGGPVRSDLHSLNRLLNIPAVSRSTNVCIYRIFTVESPGLDNSWP